jgi:branched-chain amino acid transport system substrate-binding protein
MNFEESTMINRFPVKLSNSIRAGAIAAAALLSAAGQTPAAAQNADAIKIGILAPYTGVFAAYGPKTIEQPIRLYLQEHGNKIAGRPVEVIVADDQGKPNIEIEKARDLIENQKVNVIIGLVNSAAALAVRDYIDKQKILTLITVAGARDLTQSRKSGAIFRLSFANGQTEAAGAVLTKLVGVKSMAAIGADYVAPHELLEALLGHFQKLGGKVPMTLWSPLATADFSSYLAQLKQVIGEVDAVSPMLFGADSVRFFNQYREFGMSKPLYVFGDVTEQTAFLDQVGDTASGTKTYWYYSPYLAYPVNKAFRTAFLAAYHRLPGAFSFDSWAAMQFFDSAATKANGDVGNFEAMKGAIETLKIDSPAGLIHFADHQLVHNVYLNEIKKGPDGIVAQIPMGPVITDVTQYQTIEEAQKNLTEITALKN